MYNEQSFMACFYVYERLRPILAVPVTNGSSEVMIAATFCEYYTARQASDHKSNITIFCSEENN